MSRTYFELNPTLSPTPLKTLSPRRPDDTDIQRALATRAWKHDPEIEFDLSRTVTDTDKLSITIKTNPISGSPHRTTASRRTPDPCTPAVQPQSATDSAPHLLRIETDSTVSVRSHSKFSALRPQYAERGLERRSREFDLSRIVRDTGFANTNLARRSLELTIWPEIQSPRLLKRYDPPWS